jgi:hypothetical protein
MGYDEVMTTGPTVFQVGDPVLVVDSENEGELGTIIGIAPDGKQFLVVLENGTRLILNPENLSHRY